MKKIILLLIIATAFASGIKAQTDTVNYIVVYKALNPTSQSIQRIAGFKTQVTLTDFLNTQLDSTAAPVVFDVRTKKPMTATFSTVEVQVVVKDRQRNWKIKP